MSKFNFRQVTAAGEIDIPGMARVVNAVQGNIEKNIKLLQNIPFLEGNLIEIRLGAGGTTIVHRLGRQPVGYFILRQSAFANFLDNIGDGSTDKEFILTSSAATAVKLWVF